MGYMSVPAPISIDEMSRDVLSWFKGIFFCGIKVQRHNKKKVLFRIQMSNNEFEDILLWLGNRFRYILNLFS